MYGPFQFSTPVGWTTKDCSPSSVEGKRPVSPRKPFRAVISTSTSAFATVRRAAPGPAGGAGCRGCCGDGATGPAAAPEAGATNSHFPASVLRNVPTGSTAGLSPVVTRITSPVDESNTINAPPGAALT